MQDDLNQKKIYVHAEINEHWVVDLKNTELIILRQPLDNNYQEKNNINSGTIAPLAFPDLLISVETMLKQN